MAVTSRLCAVRTEKGISQNLLSQMSGISRTGLGHTESGRVLPSLANILRIAKALDVPIEEIMEAVGEGRK